MTTATDIPLILGALLFYGSFLVSSIWFAVRLNKKELALGVKRELPTFFEKLVALTDVLCKLFVFTGITVFFMYYALSDSIVGCVIATVVCFVLVWVAMVPFWRVAFWEKSKA